MRFSTKTSRKIRAYAQNSIGRNLVLTSIVHKGAGSSCRKFAGREEGPKERQHPRENSKSPENHAAFRAW